MFKGLVLKVTKKYAVVLTEDNKYYKILAREGLTVGKQIFFLQEDIAGNSLFFWRKTVSSSLMAACVLFFFLFGGVFGLPVGEVPTYAVVSVDINPSLEMTLNSERMVTGVKVLSEDGYQVAGQYLVGLEIQDAVNVIIDRAAKAGCLKEEQTILLAAAVNPAGQKSDENQTQLLFSQLTQVDLPDQYSYLILAADYQSYVKAKENSVSLGKYEVVEMTDNEIELEKARSMKVKDLLADTDLETGLIERDSNKPDLPEAGNNKNKPQDNDKGKKAKNYQKFIKYKTVNQSKNINHSDRNDKGENNKEKRQ